MDAFIDGDNGNVRKRRNFANTYEWMSNVNKEKRMKGQEYSSTSKEGGNVKPARQQGEACASQYCKNSSFRNCSAFDEPMRKEIFDSFWDMSWKQKELYVAGLVSSIDKKQSYSEKSRRMQTITYFLRHKTRKLQVCRRMFLSTLGIKEKMLRNWMSKCENHGMQLSPEKSLRLRIESNRSSEAGQHNQRRRAFLHKWLTDLPKIESHYCRKNTKKLYFEAKFSSYQDIYKLYVNDCESKDNKENGAMKLSYPIFAKVINESNYAIFKPKKDECNICVANKNNAETSEDFKKHREEIEQMREEKYNDIKNAQCGLCVVFCMDMQAVKLVPQLNATAAYYKMKLQLHNFTIYNVVTHESDNYVWDETDGNLVSSVFATCIIKHLQNFHARFPKTHHIIIYSDGCFYQNRNVVLSNALLAFCKETNLTIEQKYLVSGHTQMECDATHSLIERKIKNKQLHLPSQFVQHIAEARKYPSPLQAHQLNYTYFLDFESIPKRYNSIRPGRSTGDHTVNMLRALAYDPSGIIYFKTNIKEDYTALPQRSKTRSNDVNPSFLHKEKIGISKRKWDDLQDLKKLLPADCHSFYDNLPYKK